MNAGGNVCCSVAILGEHDLTHQAARAMIELINPVTRTHASALAPRKGNQRFKVMRFTHAQCRDIGLPCFVRINEKGMPEGHCPLRRIRRLISARPILLTYMCLIAGDLLINIRTKFITQR